MQFTLHCFLCVNYMAKGNYLKVEYIIWDCHLKKQMQSYLFVSGHYFSGSQPL